MPRRTYNFSANAAECCDYLARRIPELSHLRPAQILFGVAFARSDSRYGTYASCQPLRFERGRSQITHRGRTWEWPVVRQRGQELLYAISFVIPRFIDEPPSHKLETFIHELYHISPRFDGDLRRLGMGRHAHHGPSRAYYDQLIAPLVSAAARLDLSPFPFLRYGLKELESRYGVVMGLKFKRLRPRLVKGSPATEADINELLGDHDKEAESDAPLDPAPPSPVDTAGVRTSQAIAPVAAPSGSLSAPPKRPAKAPTPSLFT